MGRPVTVGILGVGSLRHGPPLLAALAAYFGERDILLRLWDADGERQELMLLLAVTLFKFTQSKHALESMEDLTGVAADAQGLILCPSPHCLERAGAVDPMDLLYDAEAEWPSADRRILSLTHAREDPRIESYLDWPGPLSPEIETSLPHQILRWVHLDESPNALIEAHRDSPLKPWLDSLIDQARAV